MTDKTRKTTIEYCTGLHADGTPYVELREIATHWDDVSEGDDWDGDHSADYLDDAHEARVIEAEAESDRNRAGA